MIKTLTPPQATKLGDRVHSFAGTWVEIVSRRTWWRLDTVRIDVWLRLAEAFAKDVNGPWSLDETDLRTLTEAFRCIGDDISALEYARLHYLMLCIRAIDTAILREEKTELVSEPVAEQLAAE